MSDFRTWRFLSWGCGVQSTTLLVMAALGDLPAFDAVVHADTGWERQQTYNTRDYYARWAAVAAPDMQISITSRGDIRELGAQNHIHMPFWTASGGPLRRQCTREFKIRPVKRRMRELAGFDRSRKPDPKPGQFQLSIGISLDEWDRMTKSEIRYIEHSYPLVDLGMTREDCKEYLSSHNLPVPVKSACIGCPYRLSSEWLEMKENTPEEWRQAVAFDVANRNNPLDKLQSGELYIYKFGGPLASAPLLLDAAKERDQESVCVGGFCNT